jgi:hypothetical protein
MELLSCPKCHQEQSRNKDNYCSFCFANFEGKNNKVRSTQKRKKSRVRNIIQVEKPNNIRNVLFPFAIIEFILILIFRTNIVDDTFPLKYAGFSLIFSLFISLGLYRLIYRERFNLIIHKNRDDPRLKTFYCLYFSSVFSLILAYFIIDATLTIFPDQEYKVSIRETWVSSGKSTSYHISVSSWRKDNQEPINLLIKHDLWDQIGIGDLLIIKVRHGGLGIERIKSIKQVYH